MNEQDYILVTNRVRVSAALRLVRECSADDDIGISQGQKRKVEEILHSAEERMFKSIDEMQMS